MQIEGLVYRIYLGVPPNLKIPNVVEDLYIWTEECKVYCFASKKKKKERKKKYPGGDLREWDLMMNGPCPFPVPELSWPIIGLVDIGLYSKRGGKT